MTTTKTTETTIRDVSAYINDTYTGFDKYEIERLKEHGYRLVDVGRDDWREALDGIAARMATGREAEVTPELPADAVIVETMPDQYRESHRAANNWGVYPNNGATRQIMAREEAEELVADDEYNHIVRAAKSEDLKRYEVA